MLFRNQNHVYVFRIILKSIIMHVMLCNAMQCNAMFGDIIYCNVM